MAVTKMALNRGLDGDTETLMVLETLAGRAWVLESKDRTGRDLGLPQQSARRFWTGS